MKHSISHPARQSALIVSLMLFVVSASYADDGPTAEQCRDAFMKSPAAASCESDTDKTFVIVNAEGLCEISDTCPKHSGQPSLSMVKVPLDEASHVVNCNGKLLRQYCPE